MLKGTPPIQDALLLAALEPHDPGRPRVEPEASGISDDLPRTPGRSRSNELPDDDADREGRVECTEAQSHPMPSVSPGGRDGVAGAAAKQSTTWQGTDVRSYPKRSFVARDKAATANPTESNSTSVARWPAPCVRRGSRWLPIANGRRGSSFGESLPRPRDPRPVVVW